MSIEYKSQQFFFTTDDKSRDEENLTKAFVFLILNSFAQTI